MRTMCRLILGIAVLVAAAGVVSAQQPDSQPPPSPVPEVQVTPAPLPPDIVPPTEETTKTRVLDLIPIAPEVAAKTRPVKKGSTQAKKPAQVPAGVKPEAAAAASVAATGSGTGTADPPAGAASPVLSKKAPPAFDPAAAAETDKKLLDAARSKKGSGSWIVLGLGGLALIGLAVYFVRSRNGVEKLPSMFNRGLAAQVTAPVISGSAVRPGSDRR